MGDTQDIDSHQDVYLPLNGDGDNDNDSNDITASSILEQGYNPTQEGVKNVDNNNDIEESITITNLDDFFQQVYFYHQSNGYIPLIIKHISQFVLTSFVIGLFSLVSIGIDWSKFYSCSSHQECQQVFGLDWTRNKFINFCNIVFYIYWIINLYHLVKKLSRVKELKQFCCKHLRLSDELMNRMSWSEFTNRIISYHQQGLLPFIRRRISQESIANMIHRQDNFLCLLFSLDILNGHYYSKILSRILYNFVIKQLLINGQSINEKFINNPSDLKRRLIILSLISLILTPFLVVYYLMGCFFKEVQHLVKIDASNPNDSSDLNLSLSSSINNNHNNNNGNSNNNSNSNSNSNHNSNSSSGNGNSGSSNNNSQYRWTGHAKHLLKLHNEYSHEFEIRLSFIKWAAEDVIKCFPNYNLIGLVYMISFPLGAYIGLLVFITMFDTSRLMNIEILGYSLLSHLSLFTPILYGCRNYLSQYNKHKTIKALSSLKKLKLVESFDTEAFHNIVESTKKKTNQTQDEIIIDPVNQGVQLLDEKLIKIHKVINQLYRHKILIFFGELLGILYLWYILGVVIYKQADHILSKLKEAIIKSDDGLVCKNYHHILNPLDDDAYTYKASTVNDNANANANNDNQRPNQYYHYYYPEPALKDVKAIEQSYIGGDDVDTLLTRNFSDF